MYSSGSVCDAAGLVLGVERVEHRRRVALELREAIALQAHQPLDRQLRSDGRVLDGRTGSRRRESLVHEAAQHVVDALSGQVRLARDLGGREGLAPDERGICPRLVCRQAEAGQARDKPAGVHRDEMVAATGRGVNVARGASEAGGPGAEAAGSAALRARCVRRDRQRLAVRAADVLDP